LKKKYPARILVSKKHTTTAESARSGRREKKYCYTGEKNAYPEGQKCA